MMAYEAVTGDKAGALTELDKIAIENHRYFCIAGKRYILRVSNNFPKPSWRMTQRFTQKKTCTANWVSFSPRHCYDRSANSTKPKKICRPHSKLSPGELMY